MKQHRCYATVLPGLQSIANSFLRPDQCDLIDELVRHGRNRFRSASCQELVLDLRGLLGKAHPRHQFLVKIPVLGTHSANIETQHRTQRIVCALEIVGHDNVLALNDVEDTTLLIGVVTDFDEGPETVRLEFERRLSDHWRFELEAQVFLQDDQESVAAVFEQDSFIGLRLAYFF